MLLEALAEHERSVLDTMLARSLNSPRCSSAGRLLDGIAALLGICTRATYEGEPAIELEALAWQSPRARALHVGSDGARAATASRPTRLDAFLPQNSAYRLAMREAPTPQPSAAIQEVCLRVGEQPADCCIELDPAPILEAVLADLHLGRAKSDIALDAHLGFAQGIVRVAAETAQRTGISHVALSGGVFMNRILLSSVRAELMARGLTVLTPHEVPVNDGCIAYGQAAVARARMPR